MVSHFSGDALANRLTLVMIYSSLLNNITMHIALKTTHCIMSKLKCEKCVAGGWKWPEKDMGICTVVLHSPPSVIISMFISFVIWISVVTQICQSLICTCLYFIPEMWGGVWMGGDFDNLALSRAWEFHLFILPWAVYFITYLMLQCDNFNQILLRGLGILNILHCP